MLLLVSGEARYFCMLILYLDISLELFISSKNFLRESLSSLIQRIISCQNKSTWTLSFPHCTLFICVSCLIVLANTSSSILNKSRESGVLFSS